MGLGGAIWLSRAVRGGGRPVQDCCERGSLGLVYPLIVDHGQCTHAAGVPDVRGSMHIGPHQRLGDLCQPRMAHNRAADLEAPLLQISRLASSQVMRPICEPAARSRPRGSTPEGHCDSQWHRSSSDPAPQRDEDALQAELGGPARPADSRRIGIRESGPWLNWSVRVDGLDDRCWGLAALAQPTRSDESTGPKRAPGFPGSPGLMEPR